jgi:tape measure domain-containing protein
MRLKEEGAAAVKAAMDKLQSSLKGATTSAAKMDNATNTLSTAMRQLVGVLGARELARMSDSFTNMNARLGLVTKSTEELNRVQRQLFNLAQETRTPFEDIVNLYTRTANAAEALGLSQQQVLLVTSQTAKGVALSGSTAAEAAGAIQQLGQAFGNGMLQAQEYNSIAENTPRLARAIAESFGLTTASFRKAVLEQRITSDQLAKAILQTGELSDEFAKLPTTISGAFTQLRNQVVLFVGELNRGTGAAEFFVRVVDFIKNNLPLVTSIVVTVTAAFVAYRTALMTATAAKLALGVAEAIASGNMAKAALVTAAVTGTAFVFAETLSRLQNMMKGVSDATGGLVAAETGLPPALSGSNKEAKTQVELLVELADIAPITTGQMRVLVAEQTRLSSALASPNIGLERQVMLTQQLVAVRETLANATVNMTDAEINNQLRMGGAARSTAIPMQVQARPMVTAIDKGTMAKVRAQMDAVAAETERMAAETTQRLQQSFAGGVIMTFADALAAGFEAALATGKISEGFKAFGSVMLQGLGGMLQQFGTSALLANKLMLKLMVSMGKMNPVAGIAASLGLIALGGALKGAARSAFSGGGGGGGSYSAPAMGGGAGGGNMTMPTAFFGPTAAGSANTIERINPVNVTIIGPNDPTAQRQMQELIRNADRRGNV